MVVIVLSECWEEDNTKNSSICKKVADNRNRGIEPIVRKFHFDYFLSICKVVFFLYSLSYKGGENFLTLSLSVSHKTATRSICMHG